jgi:hypothetical protein
MMILILPISLTPLGVSLRVLSGRKRRAEVGMTGRRRT